MKTGVQSRMVYSCLNEAYASEFSEMEDWSENLMSIVDMGILDAVILGWSIKVSTEYLDTLNI